MTLENFIQEYKNKEVSAKSEKMGFEPLISRVWKEGADELMKALRIDIEFLEENHERVDKIVEILTRDDKEVYWY